MRHFNELFSCLIMNNLGMLRADSSSLGLWLMKTFLKRKSTLKEMITSQPINLIVKLYVCCVFSSIQVWIDASRYCSNAHIGNKHLFSFSAKNLSMHKCVQVDTSRRGYSINKFFATKESKKGKGSLVYIKCQLSDVFIKTRKKSFNHKFHVS